MDGATAWQRFTKVMLPVMKPAILVALLFRTLDAFRVFDNIYVLTAGANETSSVSMLAYNNLIRGLNLGIGSTMSVLIFIAVAIIAFVFVKLFGTAAPGSSRRREALMAAIDTTTRRQVRAGACSTPSWWSSRWSRCCGSRRCRSRRPATLTDGNFIPREWTLDNYRTIFHTDQFVRALVNSIGIALISTAHRGGARHDGRVRDRPAGLPRQEAAGRRLPADRDVPAGVAGLAAVRHRAQHRALRHLAGADPAVHHLRACRWRSTRCRRSSSRSRGTWRRRPRWTAPPRAQAFRRVIAPLAAPGVFTTAILVFIFCWNDFLFAISLTSTERSRTVPVALSFFTGRVAVRGPDRRDLRRGRGHHDSDHPVRAVLPAAHRRRA